MSLHVYRNDDVGYFRWLMIHPRGYVLNTTRALAPSYMVLHRPDCGLIQTHTAMARPGGFTGRGYVKVCADTEQELRAWVSSHGRPDGSFSKQCSRCGRPRRCRGEGAAPASGAPFPQAVRKTAPAEMAPNELGALRRACRQLPPARGTYLEEDFVSNLLLTVLDYQMQNTMVDRAYKHYRAHLWDALRDIGSLQRFLDRFPDTADGNVEAAQSLWGYRYGKRLHQLRDLVTFFSSVGVVDQASLRRWAAEGDYDADFKGRVKGLAYAVYNWLVMRLGVETIKPDVHVMRFVERVVGRAVDRRSAVSALQSIANELDRKAYELDWAIWETERGAPGLR
jgi:hypothetical protein